MAHRTIADYPDGDQQQGQAQWQRAKSHSGTIPPKRPARPPVSISTTTKNKLQKFQCQEPTTEQSGSSSSLAVAGPKEESHDQGNVASKSNLTTAESDPAGKMSRQAPKDGSLKTPVSRLAWQDLMGVADPDKQEENTSPNERLLWHNEHDDVAAKISPLIPRRGKKRARSSSPISSPMRTPAVNVKKLAKALKKPRADPALDLWDRFAVGGPDSKNPLGATNPALAHLMVSSSPRPQKDGTPVHAQSILRRAMSCGTHWPKRRRVESASECNSANETEDATKSSMVTALLETVNGEINKTEEAEEDFCGMESPSIKKRRSPREPRLPPKSTASRPFSHNINSTTATGNRAHSPETRRVTTPTSDYGDDEFDDDTLLELDASLLSGQDDARSFSAAAETLVDVTVGATDWQGPKQEVSADDEFDDVDDDLLAAAEDMIVDVPANNSSKPTPVSPPKAVHLDGGTTDDELYGDDFGGDFDFEAAELAATQTVGETTSSLMRVRTIR